MENTQLQQSNNEGIIVGKLKEKKIDFAVGKESGKAYAKGHLTLVVNTVDGINEIKVAEKESSIMYDLSGRKVNSPRKGLYIIDSKKIIVK